MASRCSRPPQPEPRAARPDGRRRGPARGVTGPRWTGAAGVKSRPAPPPRPGRRGPSVGPGVGAAARVAAAVGPGRWGRGGYGLSCYRRHRSAPTRPARGSGISFGAPRPAQAAVQAKVASRRSCRCRTGREDTGEGRPRIPGLGWKPDPSPGLLETAAWTGRA